MILPKETGWTYSIEKDRIMGDKAVFSSANTNSRIRSIKIESEDFTQIEISGSGVKSFYAKLAALEIFQPYLGILNPIHKFLGKLIVEVSLLKEEAPTEAKKLLKVLFALIESDFEPTFAAVKPYILETIKLGVPKTVSSKAKAPKKSASSTRPDNSENVFSVSQDKNKGSTAWDESHTRDGIMTLTNQEIPPAVAVADKNSHRREIEYTGTIAAQIGLYSRPKKPKTVPSGLGTNRSCGEVPELTLTLENF